MRRVLIPLHVPDIAPLVARAAQIVSLSGERMGTSWSVKAATDVAERELSAIVEAALSLVIAQMSQWEPTSDLSRFNRAAPGTWQTVPQEFCSVLECALELARQTNGAYDPTIGALTDLWGFGAAGRREDVPAQAEIETARAQGGWRAIRFDAARRALLQPGDMWLDLSSIAKGFAVDLVSGMLLKRGVTNHLVEIGGELRGHGVKPDGFPWWVELEGGRADEKTIVALHEVSIATSGDVRRHIKAGDRLLSHTLDPRTGWPVPDDVAFVTVLDRSCMKADALATALTVLGAEVGYQFAAERDIAARFLIRDGGGMKELITPAFAAMLD